MRILLLSLNLNSLKRISNALFQIFVKAVSDLGFLNMFEDKDEDIKFFAVREVQDTFELLTSLRKVLRLINITFDKIICVTNHKIRSHIIKKNNSDFIESKLYFLINQLNNIHTDVKFHSWS